MKFDVVAVRDVGDKYRARFVDTYENSLMKNDEHYIKCSNAAGDAIRDAISKNKMVFLPKGVQGELTSMDVVITEVDGLTKDIMIALSDVYRKMDYGLFNVGAINYFDYLTVFSKLASLGYFITDDNREEKYLEIIETGDEELISDLELYLESMDKLSHISYTYHKTRKFEKDALNCKNKEELDALVDDFDKRR